MRWASARSSDNPVSVTGIDATVDAVPDLTPDFVVHLLLSRADGQYWRVEPAVGHGA